MNTRVISDSSCDMKNGERKNLYIVPLTVSTDNEKWIDNGKTNIENMLTTLEKHKGRSYTACPDVNSWLEAFEGADILYVITMTSGLSGTYNSAQAAAKIYKENHPNARIMILDTLSTSSHQRLVVDYVCDLIEKGTEFEEIENLTKEYISKTRLVYVLKSLRNFAQNGRVNKAIAAAIGVLGINILAGVTDEGTVKPLAKCRGNRKVIAEFLKQMKEANCSGNKFYISHVDNISLANELKTAILENYPNAEIDIRPAKALCSYYAERGGLLLGFETE